MKCFWRRCARVALLLSVVASLLSAVLLIAKSPVVSGKIIGGYRMLPVEASSETLHFVVYRGDYIKFDLDPALATPVLAIPDLEVQETLPASVGAAPYFKMKKSGTHAFTLGNRSGVIEVVDFDQPDYREVTAEQAQALINDTAPLVLDVRTPREYQKGHLEGSLLIPLQELQARWPEIADHQNQDVLIYCATGNRSTVAAKILIDSGFRRIVNMRHGIVDWARQGYPVQ